MPGAAVRFSDFSVHGGNYLVVPIPKVMIENKPAAGLGDLHVCPLPPAGHQPTVSPIIKGSAKILIGGKPAVSVTDPCGCGAIPNIATCATKVMYLS